MGLYLVPGHQYSDTSPNNAVNGANLNEHVSEAVLKTTTISSQTLKDPAALSDEILVNDGGSFKKETWQQVYALMIQAGTVIQTVYSEYTANTNLTTTIPADDTIPQNTEGTEIISVSITPRFSNSTILCIFEGQYSTSTQASVIGAIFRDSVVNSIRAVRGGMGDATSPLDNIHLVCMDSPSTTSPVTYKVRVGPGSAATMRMNGTSSARLMGGVSASTLVLQEIKV